MTIWATPLDEGFAMVVVTITGAVPVAEIDTALLITTRVLVGGGFETVLVTMTVAPPV